MSNATDVSGPATPEVPLTTSTRSVVADKPDTIENLFAAQEAFEYYLRIVLAALALVGLVAGLLLYRIDPEALKEILKFAWSVREALIVLAVTLSAAWLLGRAIKPLARLASHIKNTLNIAIADLNDASTELEGVLNNVEKKTKELKEAAERQLLANQAASSAQEIPPSPVQSPQPPTTAAPPVDTTGEDYWEDIRRGFKKIKDLIEQRVDTVDDGRTYAKYGRMQRYDYEPIVEKLIDDGLLAPCKLAPFQRMKQTFVFYRPQRWVVPIDVWRKFQLDMLEFMNCK